MKKIFLMVLILFINFTSLSADSFYKEYTNDVHKSFMNDYEKYHNNFFEIKKDYFTQKKDWFSVNERLKLEDLYFEDTIYNDKFYKKYDKIIFDDKKNYFIETATNIDYIIFYFTDFSFEVSPSLNMYSNFLEFSKFAVNNSFNGEAFYYIDIYKTFYFRIKKNDLISPNVQGFKEYLKKEPLKVIYEIKSPKIYDLKKDYGIVKVNNGLNKFDLEKNAHNYNVSVEKNKNSFTITPHQNVDTKYALFKVFLKPNTAYYLDFNFNPRLYDIDIYFKKNGGLSLGAELYGDKLLNLKTDRKNFISNYEKEYYFLFYTLENAPLKFSNFMVSDVETSYEPYIYNNNLNLTLFTKNIVAEYKLPRDYFQNFDGIDTYFYNCNKEMNSIDKIQPSFGLIVNSIMINTNIIFKMLFLTTPSSLILLGVPIGYFILFIPIIGLILFTVFNKRGM